MITAGQRNMKVKARREYIPPCQDKGTTLQYGFLVRTIVSISP